MILPINGIPKLRPLLALVLLLQLSGIVLQAQQLEASSNPVSIDFTFRDTKGPDIFLVYKNKGVVNSEGKLEVEIRIFDLSGISEVVINDVERQLDNIPDSISISAAFPVEAEVSIRAVDTRRNSSEKTVPIRQQAIDKNLKVKHTNYALLIGVEKYRDNTIDALSEPIKDAGLLKDVLVDKYGFEESDIMFLKNPTYKEIDQAFSTLADTVKSTDLLLIFYAGHGYYDAKTEIGYWLPSDAMRNSRATWFRNSMLVENIRTINSKHTLLITDACFSGDILKTRSAINNANPNIAYLMSHSSRKAITSGSLTTVPDKSVFMKYLIKILKENELDYLASDDLYHEVRQSMRYNATTVPLYGVIQTAGDEGGNFVLIRKQK